MIRANLPAIGTRVRIERDEHRYPARGSWNHYRGRTGTVILHNGGEIGVTFTGTRRDHTGRLTYSGTPTWFQPHEVQPINGDEDRR